MISEATRKNGSIVTGKGLRAYGSWNQAEIRSFVASSLPQEIGYYSGLNGSRESVCVGLNWSESPPPQQDVCNPPGRDLQER